MKPHNRDNMRLAEEAALWLTRLTEDETPTCREEFVGWLKRSPRHMEEFLLVSATRQLFRDVDPDRRLDIRKLLADASSSIVPFRADDTIGNELEEGSHSRHSPLVKKARRRWIVGIAAAFVGCVILGVALIGGYRHGGDTYSTGVGEQRAFRLPDGSLLHLNTRSRVKVRFSEHMRDVSLMQGEALFTVQHDAARPFRVLTNSALVQAVGTQFDVYERPDGTRVSVIQGSVRIVTHQAGTDEPSVVNPRIQEPAPATKSYVDHLPTPSFLIAGEQAIIGTDGKVAKGAELDISTTLAWRERRLAFRGTPLAEVAEQFNRYNIPQIHVAGPTLSARRITAVFNADEPQALITFLERDNSVQVERHPDSFVVHSKSDLSPVENR